ncbi:MAG: PASTA domain-containing protein, partial [Clostridiales bacterium]|nr:PASTA domain-containing protein [Clostridiales bacterium]
PDFGSVTAAPFARDILLQSLQYLGIPRVDANQTAPAIVPDVTGMTASQAQKALSSVGLQPVLSGAGNRVIDQLPAAGASMPQKSLVMLYVDGDVNEAERRVEVPDVLGSTVAEAERLLKAYELAIRVDGGGIAVAQSPAAGEMVTPTTAVTVTFETPA